MIDLNHGSGCQYEAPEPCAWHRRRHQRGDRCGRCSRATAHSRRGAMSARPGSARCLRQIQYDYLAVPKDEGRDFERQHAAHLRGRPSREDIVAAWLRAAGFDLRTTRADGRQFGFSCARRPVPRSHRRLPGRRPGSRWSSRRCGRTRRSALAPGRRWSSGRRRSQSRSTPRRSRSTGLSRSAEPGAVHRAQPRHLGAPLRARAVRRGARAGAERPGRRRSSAPAKPRSCCRAPRPTERSAICRGGRTAGEWHAPCAWQDRCWRARP